MELPVYTIRASVLKILIPKAAKLLGLALLLYAGIWLNIYLMKRSIPDTINYLIIAIIAVLVLIEALLAYNQTVKHKYYFFQGRIEFRGKQPKTIDFRYITNITVSKNFLDKILKTGTIVIQPEFKIRSIKNPDQVAAYLQQLVQRVAHPILQQQRQQINQ